MDEFNQEVEDAVASKQKAIDAVRAVTSPTNTQTESQPVAPTPTLTPEEIEALRRENSGPPAPFGAYMPGMLASMFQSWAPGNEVQRQVSSQYAPWAGMPGMGGPPTGADRDWSQYGSGKESRVLDESAYADEIAPGQGNDAVTPRAPAVQGPSLPEVLGQRDRLVGMYRDTPVMPGTMPGGQPGGVSLPSTPSVGRVPTPVVELPTIMATELKKIVPTAKTPSLSSMFRSRR